MQVPVTEVRTRAQCVLIFYTQGATFEAEQRAFEDPSLRPAMPVVKAIVPAEQLTHETLPLLLGVHSFPHAVVRERGLSLNAIVVTQHPSFGASMQVRAHLLLPFVQSTRSCASCMTPSRVQIIMQVSEKVNAMHDAGWAHLALQPSNLFWLSLIHI